MIRIKQNRRIQFFLVTSGIFLLSCCAFAADYPAMNIEIGPEHPLLVFGSPQINLQKTDDYVQEVVAAWNSLDPELKPFSVLTIDITGAGDFNWPEFLAQLQERDISVMLQVATRGKAVPLKYAEELVGKYTCIKGISASDFMFNNYHSLGAGTSIDVTPEVRWLTAAIELAARNGKAILIELDELGWPRIMSNTACEPLYQKIRECKAYVVPAVRYPDLHGITQVSSVMGLWLEDAASHWGIGSNTSRSSETEYKSAILVGAMTGATVYSFDKTDDLWFGQDNDTWQEVIRPSLIDIVNKGFIAGKDFVSKKTKVAYRLSRSATSQDFHINLRDLDPYYDEGLMMRAAYNIDPSRQLIDRVPDNSDYYWIPVVSPYISPENASRFETVVRGGMIPSVDAWRELLNRFYKPQSEGNAFITRVGRCIFIMNSSEDVLADQEFSINGVPMPVHNFEVKRGDSGIVISWPFREGDVSYRVYRRVLPETNFTVITTNADGLQYIDANANEQETLAYTVTALTNERGLYRGTVGHDEYLALSVVESRIDEEAVISPLVSFASSRNIEKPIAVEPVTEESWPDIDGLDESHALMARNIAQRVDDWKNAFEKEDLDAVLDIYSRDYKDPQGYKLQYVKAAYQSFFKQNGACRMYRRLMAWDFSNYETTGIVNVRIACRLSGVAITDSTGYFADIPAHFPRTENGEIIVSFTDRQGSWHIIQTNPPVPDLKDILTLSGLGSK